MAYYLGIDAGGTKTSCALADETSILARATAGTIKLSRIDPAGARTNLETLLNEVSASSGVTLRSVAATCMGYAGHKIPAYASWATAAMQDLIGGAHELCGDMEIGLDAAFAGGPGALAISGTGSIVVARGSQGTTTQAGGMGSIVSDEGSGYWIGRRAVAEAMGSHDGAEPGDLLRGIMRAWNCGVFNDVVVAVNASPTPDFAALVPLVCDCAAGGDAMAAGILEDAGQELALLVIKAVGRLRRVDPELPAPMPVALVGSILERIHAVRQSMTDALMTQGGELLVLEKIVDPIEGALWRARRGR